MRKHVTEQNFPDKQTAQDKKKFHAEYAAPEGKAVHITPEARKEQTGMRRQYGGNGQSAGHIQPGTARS